MRDFICVPFGEDLISAALREIVDPAVLVFPTRVSAAQARTRFQNHWQFEDVEFITMDDLKSSSILPPQPSLADEKRLLCLWQVLDDEDRAQFHLTQYDDIVEWGGSFFRFFDELCDECVDAETLGALDSSGTMYLQAWQALYIDRVLQIRARYLAMIGSLGFTDPIFYVSEKNIRLNRKPARYIFVNQFYYSELEKRMISVLEESGNRIYVIWQGLEDSFDQGSLKMKSPILEDLQDGDFRVEKIEIIKTENEDQMVLAFLEAHAVELSQSLDEKDKKLSARLILDRQFCAKPYRELFARKVFAYPQAVSFSQSDLWQMLQLWQTHLEALAQSREQRYLPLRLVLQACSRELFVRFYQPDWGIVQRDALLREIKSLSRDDYLYLDKDLELFDLLSAEKQYPLLQSVMKSHFALLKQLGGIKNITGLCHIIDLSGALEIKAMCSPNELLYSDIREQFYERLANFCSIEHLGIVSDWRAIYADSGIALSARILKLFIEYLKSARYRFQKSGGAETLYEIGNLLDSRDLRYDVVIFFH
ncbi:MAG: hypothetical protein Q8J62_09450, partial [Candidatus Cloacimonadaceae bacterium]|nr:hypothetical protein [Candidatus Cloacimonadaceae bacterium]